MSKDIFAAMASLAAKEPEAQVSPEESELLLSSVQSQYDGDLEMQLSSVSKVADITLRTQALSIVIEWIKSGETDYEALETLVANFVNDDDEPSLSEEEQEEADELLQAVAQVVADFTDLSVAKVERIFEEGDDDQAIEVADLIERKIEDRNIYELIADYAAKQELLLSAVKKVVRNGKIVTIKKRTKKRRMTPAQKAALKKARKKANNSAARAKRKKSNRLRKSKGI
uniref:Baseplate or tail tube n=2 Tax=Vibrio TaxID=662 RepID=A0A0H3ZT81_9VIBR|nr:baseplate or tail tube [Vibrio cyclitrophicus]AKN38212.1 hypothetical protein [Vibrio splendidus]